MVQRKQSTVHKDALVRPDASDGRQPLRVHLDAYHRIWGSLLAINHREPHLATPSPTLATPATLSHTPGPCQHGTHSIASCEPANPLHRHATTSSNMNPSQPALPPPSTLTDPSVTPSTITDALDLLFEPSPTLHALAVPIIKDASAPFDTYADLIAAVEARLKALAAAGQTEQLDSILGSHPRLGEKKVDSALSRKEQAAMGQGGQDGQPQDNSIDFAALNAMYEQKFPGLRFV